MDIIRKRLIAQAYSGQAASEGKAAVDDAKQTNGLNGASHSGKKQILINAFDMSTIGHLSPGQWKDPLDKSTTKNRLDYWINLAKLLEKGNINALFLADTTSPYETYNQSADECIRRAAQWPMTDPSIPISAMAAVTTNLCFGITTSTSFESPFLLAKRFSTLDHLTNGRIAWNIVTSYKRGAFRAIGLDNPIEHDQRYAQADEYMRVLYKLWNGSWSDDAILADAENDVYFDPQKIKVINHKGRYYSLEARHLVDPTPQRTPFLFQAGASPAGSDFASTHAEAIFVQAHTPEILKSRIANIRKLAAEKGRDPRSLKFFATLTPIIAKTDEEAKEKLERIRKNASTIGGLVLFSGWTGIDVSNIPLDQVLTEADSKEASKIHSAMKSVAAIPNLTPRAVAETAGIGGMSPLSVGSAQTVADDMERWISVGDLDGFNIAYTTTPGTFEDVVELLIPELRRRGIYPEPEDGLTAREKIYGKGQARVRDDHVASTYNYDVYKEEAPYQAPE